MSKTFSVLSKQSYRNVYKKGNNVYIKGNIVDEIGITVLHTDDKILEFSIVWENICTVSGAERASCYVRVWRDAFSVFERFKEFFSWLAKHENDKDLTVEVVTDFLKKAGYKETIR